MGSRLSFASRGEVERVRPYKFWPISYLRFRQRNLLFNLRSGTFRSLFLFVSGVSLRRRGRFSVRGSGTDAIIVIPETF
jgi:hypothetical protein